MTRQLSDILIKYRQSCLHCPEKLSWPPQRDRYLAVWASAQDMADFYEHTADSDLGRRKYNRLLSAVHTIPSHTRDPVVADHAIICSPTPWCCWPIEVVKRSGPSVMVIDLIALSAGIAMTFTDLPVFIVCHLSGITRRRKELLEIGVETLPPPPLPFTAPFPPPVPLLLLTTSVSEAANRAHDSHKHFFPSWAGKVTQIPAVTKLIQGLGDLLVVGWVVKSDTSL